MTQTPPTLTPTQSDLIAVALGQLAARRPGWRNDLEAIAAALDVAAVYRESHDTHAAAIHSARTAEGILAEAITNAASAFVTWKHWEAPILGHHPKMTEEARGELVRRGLAQLGIKPEPRAHETKTD